MSVSSGRVVLEGVLYGEGEEWGWTGGVGVESGGSAICRSLWWMTGVCVCVCVKGRERLAFLLSALSLFPLSSDKQSRAGLSERRTDVCRPEHTNSTKTRQEWSFQEGEKKENILFFTLKNCSAYQGYITRTIGFVWKIFFFSTFQVDKIILADLWGVAGLEEGKKKEENK